MIWNLKESSVKKIILKIVFAVAAVAIVPMSAAVNAQEPSAEDLAKAAQNPIASMISLPFQNNTNTNFGPEEKTQNILNIQPVWPFSVGENWNLITRTILPVMSTARIDTKWRANQWPRRYQLFRLPITQGSGKVEFGARAVLHYCRRVILN